MRDDLTAFREDTTDLTALEGVGLLMGHQIGAAINRIQQGDDATVVVFALLDDLGSLMAEVPTNRVTHALLHAAAGRGMDKEVQ